MTGQTERRQAKQTAGHTTVRQTTARQAQTLVKWMIDSINKDSYRAGILSGMKHPVVDAKLIEAVGGRQSLLEQVRELEKGGLLQADWRDLGADVKQLHYSVEIMPALCQKAGVKDPRERQLDHIRQMTGWRQKAEGTFLAPYYDELLKRLRQGHNIKDPDMDDEPFFRCLDAIIHLEKPIWKRVFSAQPHVFGNSKTFESKKYEPRLVTVLRRSPLCEEGMSDEEVLNIHGILTYAQTLEWKGALKYRLDNGTIIDSAPDYYGTIINAQTLEHAVPYALPGIKRILIIENKANYENMIYSQDSLYVFCHGFFSPKEVRFLKHLTEIAGPDIEFLHWGDMDFGGIRIFLFNQSHIFSALKPYRMDKTAFDTAVSAGAGIALTDAKRNALNQLDAGALTELKHRILESGLEIEQETLLARQ